MPQSLQIIRKACQASKCTPSYHSNNRIGQFMLNVAAILAVFMVSVGQIQAQTLVQLASSTNPFLGMPTSSLNSNIQLVDIDADGDLDAYAGQSSGAIEFYENQGSKTIPAYASPVTLVNVFAPNGNSTPTLADLDGDGDYDMMIGDEAGAFYYYENVGTKLVPDFILASSANHPLNGVNEGNYAMVSFADIDADGDMDAFIGNTNGAVVFYENQGTAAAASFVKLTGTANPLNGVTVGARSYINLSDADGDGDYDATIGDGNGTMTFYHNIGTANVPTFVQFTHGLAGISLNFGANSSPFWADIDGDGDMDLFIGEDSGDFEYFQNIYLFGCGAFTQQTNSANPLVDMDDVTANSSSVAFCDFDMDGDQDAVVGSLNHGLIYFENTGSATMPTFTEIGDYLNAASPFFGMSFNQTSVPAIVDIDGDGDCDIFVGNALGTIQYIRNNGGLSFTMMGALNNPLSSVGSIQRSFPTFGDIDGDGDYDAFIGEQNGSVLFYRNEGTAIAPSFTNITGNANPLNSVATVQNATPRLVDLNKDGDLDAVVGSITGTIQTYENAGNAETPIFTKLIGTDNPFNAVAMNNSSNAGFTDLNGDGSIDVFFGDDRGVLFYYSGAPCHLMPVELTAFNATAIHEAALLTWETASEDGNEGFEVLRSTNGEDWETIGFVEGAGYTNNITRYEFWDETPKAGVNYYRLKQIDFNGNFENSEIRAVEFESPLGTISVYPNPVQDVFNVELGNTPTDVRVYIYNIAGQLQREVSLNDRMTSFNINDLSAGLYILNIVGDGVNENVKLIKRR